MTTGEELDPELQRLRQEIAALDRELLATLNRRLELVRRVQEHKQGTGVPLIDAQREAELLGALVGANRGPLSDEGVTAVFAAVLDVMKQELRGEQRLPREPATAPRRPAVSRLAIVGTGLVGTSVALAAARSGVERVTGWDSDRRTLDEATGSAAVQPGSSLADAVAGAELVVVAAPVAALPETVREALAGAPAATVTDVGSTKRALDAIDDPRFVPGHPLAGSATGGPAHATVDLFEGATWFLTPHETTSPESVELVERFVASLGAEPVRIEADEHDRLLALTSHLPHALANVLVRSVGRAGEPALRYTPPSLREMTRVAGANPAVWADIFVANGDLIADALSAHEADLGELEQALRQGDRAFLERWIAEAAATRSRMLEHAYRTEARLLNRIRIRVPDKPGVLARITQTLGAAGINIEDFELRHVSPEYGGVLVILVAGAEKAELARVLLRRDGYTAA
jgi:prephenate dehydrogenase